MVDKPRNPASINIPVNALTARAIIVAMDKAGYELGELEPGDDIIKALELTKLQRLSIRQGLALQRRETQYLVNIII